jgi:hypothetical protein
MLIDAESLADGSELRSDVTVVGAGAAGIVIALELARAGMDVRLVESGHRSYSERVQALADASAFSGAPHPPMNECTRRQLGGTSVIWGGRVVPYDPVDFDDRPYVPHSKWPIAFSEIESRYARACTYLQCGKPEFNARQIPAARQPGLIPGLPDAEVTSSSLERWSVMNFGSVYAKDLERSARVQLTHGLTCTEIDCEKTDHGFRARSIVARTLSGKTMLLKSRRFVLACGGLNTTRLLLVSDGICPGGVGNHSGLLGRFYTGHISGRIAEAHFSTDPKRTEYGFDRDPEGVYVRRRFTFSREFQHARRLGNISAWPVNPELGDASHGNGVLSFAYLILSSPLGKHLASEAIRKSAIEGGENGRGTVSKHVLNMLRDLPRTAAFIPTFGYKRYFASRKVPGFFQYSRSNVYPLHYFGEQMPNPDSRVTLTDERDELGMRRIRVDHRFTQRDVDYVIEAHRHWDEYLRRHNRGRLRYLEEDVAKSVWEQSGDGFHQVGTTRMSARPEEGVVGPRGNVHGFDDLFVASSSAFVTSSQANSMLTILAFALRTADILAAESRA